MDYAPHFEDGNAPLTQLTVLPNAKTKILNGFEPFEAHCGFTM
jgi:hypothetical protein